MLRKGRRLDEYETLKRAAKHSSTATRPTEFRDMVLWRR